MSASNKTATKMADRANRGKSTSSLNKATKPEERERIDAMREKMYHDLFRECAPTHNRLEEIGRLWLDQALLRRRLLYCKPFTIMYEKPEAAAVTKSFTLWPGKPQEDMSIKLVTKSHHELFELCQSPEWNNFQRQVLRAWPKSFGLIQVLEGQAPYFQWQTGTPHLDDGTSYICRKPSSNGTQPLLEFLFHGFEVHLHPTDDMLWQIMPRISTSMLTMPTVAFLESLFAPTHIGFVGLASLSDWFPIQDISPVLYSTGDFGNGDWLCIRFNMRTCISDEGGHRIKQFKDGYGIKPGGLGFPLKRQAARIPGLGSTCDQFAIEFLISVSIVLRKRQVPGMPSVVRHSVVVWLDYQADTNEGSERRPRFPVLSEKVETDLDLKDCGAGGDGFFRFMVVLVRAINQWSIYWHSTLDKIDEIVGVQLQDTLDNRRWKMLMFDDSFQLSQQYFTVLQLLRIFREWIDEVKEGLGNLEKEIFDQCASWRAWRQKEAPLDETEWRINMKNLLSNMENINAFFELRVDSLQDRMQRKKDEIESLRDGLFNAASLREARKAKTLNLYIGVFTTVTVFFTPLGFMATFWAIPFLAQNGDTATPSGFTTSFVAVPMLTYFLSAAFIVYVWNRSSRGFRGFLVEHARNAGEILSWIVGSILVRMKLAFKKIKKQPRDQEANVSEVEVSEASEKPWLHVPKETKHKDNGVVKPSESKEIIELEEIGGRQTNGVPPSRNQLESPRIAGLIGGKYGLLPPKL